MDAELLSCCSFLTADGTTDFEDCGSLSSSSVTPQPTYQSFIGERLVEVLEHNGFLTLGPARQAAVRSASAPARLADWRRTCSRNEASSPAQLSLQFSNAKDWSDISLELGDVSDAVSVDDDNIIVTTPERDNTLRFTTLMALPLLPSGVRLSVGSLGHHKHQLPCKVCVFHARANKVCRLGALCTRCHCEHAPYARPRQLKRRRGQRQRETTNCETGAGV